MIWYLYSMFAPVTVISLCRMVSFKHSVEMLHRVTKHKDGVMCLMGKIYVLDKLHTVMS